MWSLLLRISVPRIHTASALTSITRSIKTHSGTKKRWTALANGAFKRGHSGHRHGLFTKSSGRLSILRGSTLSNKDQTKKLRRLMPTA